MNGSTLEKNESGGLATSPDTSAARVNGAASPVATASRGVDQRRTIPQTFAEHVAGTPHALAVRCGGQTLTYARLDRLSDRIAYNLQRSGVQRETVVAVMLERGIQLVPALLGILKAGGAYMPLDPDYPAERKELILRASGSRIVVTSHTLVSRVPAGVEQIVGIDSELPDRPDGWQPVSVGSDSLAYVLFTSGSTGEPKAVLIEHEGVVQLARDASYFGFESSDVFLQLAPLAFDATTFEIWGPLLNGASIAVMPSGLPSPHELGTVIREQQVTCFSFTPSLLQVMVDCHAGDLRGVRKILAGGEVLPVALAHKVLMRLPGCRLVNGYGPTECTSLACCHEVRPADLLRPSIPIGRPVGGKRVYVLDSELHPLREGEIGEICIGGVGVGRGYLNADSQTAARFGPDVVQGSGRLYRTGDTGRLLGCGAIEFCGRGDDQVKIRGCRIELGEIEAAIRRHPHVADGVVLVRQIAGRPDPLLTAYWVGDADRQSLRQHLERILPRQMHPTGYIRVSSFPLTNNGKVDKRRLAEHVSAPRSGGGPGVPMSTAVGHEGRHGDGTIQFERQGWRS